MQCASHKKSENGETMSVKVNIPTILRPLTNDQKQIETAGTNVLEVINQMDKNFPGFKEKLISKGKQHQFINIYINDNDIRFCDGLTTNLKDGDSLTILPAVAGG
jgi:sulfur-carrier protein